MLLGSFLTSICFCVLKWFKKKTTKHLTPMYKGNLLTSSDMIVSYVKSWRSHKTYSFDSKKKGADKCLTNGKTNSEACFKGPLKR